MASTIDIRTSTDRPIDLMTPGSLPPSPSSSSVLGSSSTPPFHSQPDLGEHVFTPMKLDSRVEFVCGWGAASVNIIMTFPLNKLIFRQQLTGINSRSALQQLRTEGLIHLYRGVLPPLLQKSTSLSIMFGTYDHFNRSLTRRFSAPPAVNKTVSAMLSGCMEAVLTPFERVQTLLQDKLHHERYRNTLHAFRDIGREHGAREFYRGLTPIIIRNGPSNIIFFLFRNDLKRLMPASRTKTGDAVRNFASGGILGAVISTLFYPVNVVKTRMQCTVGGPYQSVVAVFRVVFEERGRSWRALFRGVHMNYTRSMISWGIINTSYELLKSLLCRDGECRE